MNNELDRDVKTWHIIMQSIFGVIYGALLGLCFGVLLGLLS